MQKLLQCFSNKNVLKGHKKICFKKIGEQAIKLDGGFVEFKNYSKQIAVPLKTYADFQCILKSVKSDEGFYTGKYQDHIPYNFFTSLFVLMINLVNQFFFIEVEMLLISFLKEFFKSMNTVKR